MRFSFTFERLSMRDLANLLGLSLKLKGYAGGFEAADAVLLIEMIGRALDGSLDDVPIAEYQACMTAFVAQYGAFMESNPAALEPFRRALDEQSSA